MTSPLITPQRKGKVTYPNDWKMITNKIIKARNESVSNKT